MSRRQLEQVLSVLGLVSFVAAQQLLGDVAAVRVAGVLCLVGAAFCIFRRPLPARSQGRDTAQFQQITPGLLLGLAMLAVGMALLAFPARAACLLGWSACL